MSRRIRLLFVAVAAVVAVSIAPGSGVACSPPFGQPTIAELAPQQVVLLGVTGAKVPAGRLFHVERAWNAIEQRQGHPSSLPHNRRDRSHRAWGKPAGGPRTRVRPPAGFKTVAGAVTVPPAVRRRRSCSTLGSATRPRDQGQH